MYFSNYCFQCSLSMNTLKPFRIYYSGKWADCSHTLNSCSCVDWKMQYLYLFHAGIKNPHHKCLENKALSFAGKCKWEWANVISEKYWLYPLFFWVVYRRLIYSEIYAWNLRPLTLKLKELEKAKEPGPRGRMRKVLVYELRVKKKNWWWSSQSE